MATDRERMANDASNNGFNPKSFWEYDQRSYIALKLFQIEEHLRRIANMAVIASDEEGIG
jgi:hypothetical protein